MDRNSSFQAIRFFFTHSPLTLTFSCIELLHVWWYVEDSSGTIGPLTVTQLNDDDAA